VDKAASALIYTGAARVRRQEVLPEQCLVVHPASRHLLRSSVLCWLWKVLYATFNLQGGMFNHSLWSHFLRDDLE
jgi:hypothetical protein